MRRLSSVFASNSPHPLGPLVARERLGHPVSSRLKLVMLLITVAAPLLVAVRLTPDPSGSGTHRQLGLQACNVLVTTGVPCPACGITTAFAHTVRGEFPAAFAAHPMGLLLAIVAIICVGVAVASLVTGDAWRINWYRVSPVKTVVAVVILFAASWVFKIMTVAT